MHFVVRVEARGWILATLSDNLGTALVRDTVMCKVYREKPMCSLTFNIPDSVKTTCLVNSFSLFSFTDAIFLSYIFENILWYIAHLWLCISYSSFFQKVKRWWPNGMGEQFLYSLQISWNDTQQSKPTRVAFRTVELVQQPITNATGHCRSLLNYTLYNNRSQLFSSWLCVSTCEQARHKSSPD